MKYRSASQELKTHSYPSVPPSQAYIMSQPRSIVVNQGKRKQHLGWDAHHGVAQAAHKGRDVSSSQRNQRYACQPYG